MIFGRAGVETGQSRHTPVGRSGFSSRCWRPGELVGEGYSGDADLMTGGGDGAAVG